MSGPQDDAGAAGTLARAHQCIGEGDADGAMALASALLKQAEEQADAVLQAEATLCLATTELRLRGGFRSALELSQRAAVYFQRAEETAGECRALGTHAIAAARLGQYERAMEHSLLAVRLASSLGPCLEQVTSYHALGIAAFSGQNFVEAHNAYQQAIRLAARCEPPVNPFELLVDLASTEALHHFTERNLGGQRLSTDMLARHVEECQRLRAEAVGDIGLAPGSQAGNLLVLGLCRTHLLAWQGRLAEADAALEDLRRLRQRAGRPWMQAAVHWASSEIALARGDLEAASAEADVMVVVASRHGHESLAAIGHHLASHVRQARGDHRGALAALRRLSQREQQARAESLKTRVDVIEWQLELRQKEQRVRRLETDTRLYERLAMEDSLTGLANRRRAEAAIARALEDLRAEDSPWCLALLDVDRFKQVNDRFSHNVGDEVLKALAQILRACLREKDLPARLAGDEFVLLLREVDLDGARHICRRIEAAVRAHDWSGLADGLQASVSIGLAQARPGEAPAALMLRSDQDMYRRKEQASRR